jgi:ABC-type multidrug transport system, ATPase component
VNRVRLDNVAKRFGRRQVLRDFSASFDEGVTLLTGPNGSGKTTVLNLVANVIAADSGSIRVLDTPVEAAKGHVFIAPSSGPAIPWLSGRAFIEFAASLFRTRIAREDTRRIVEALGLHLHIDKPLGEMSSGTAKKVVIASAFASGAPVLLFDEPTNELDAGSVGFFLELIHGAPQKVIVVATHRTEQFDANAPAVVKLHLQDQPPGER